MILSERARVVGALGIVQILAWGSTFYLLAVLAGPIAADTGWSAGTITGGVSIALLVSGLSAGRVGRLIQRSGGRPVLTTGILLLAAGLAMLGLAGSVPVYLGAWIVLGAGMAASLYEAAFSTLGRLYGREARSAITAMTLWGGCASTVCWPLSAFLVEAAGWRAACLAYALLHLGVTLPLCRIALPRAAPPPVASTPDAPEPEAGERLDLRFWCIAVAGMGLAMLFSIMSVHLITILLAQGRPLSVAVGLGAVIGPAQVGARFLELLGRGRHHPVLTMIAAAFLVLCGLAMLPLGAPAAIALVAYGAGTGLWSIARGALPLAVYGPRTYPVMLGRLAAPMLVASAAAPLIGAALIERIGPAATIRGLAIAAAIPCCAALVLFVRLRRPASGP